MNLTFLVLFTGAVGLIAMDGHKARATCPDKTLNDIPSDHLFHKKQKPLIIGHRGNPKEFQENTLEGFKSLVDLGADGFEADIYLTKDKKLVIFHDDNMKKLTGENKFIWEMTSDEIKKLNLMKTLRYGSRTYNYTEQRKIPMLETVLNTMKDCNLLMYLEMKPMHNPRWDEEETRRSNETGKAVAKMVTKLGLENKVLLVSFDPVKVWAAKQENPKLVTGYFYWRGDWEKNAIDLKTLRTQYEKEWPELRQCFLNIPNGTAFDDFLFNGGIIPKTVNASFVDMQDIIIDNSIYTNNTFSTLRTNYSLDVSTGVSTIYSMTMTPKEVEATENHVQDLINKGVQRLFTDDVPRLQKKLKRGKPDICPATAVKCYSSTSKGSGFSANVVIIFVSMTMLIVKVY